MSINFNRDTKFNNPFLFQLIQSAFNSLPDLIYIMKVENNHFIYQYANQSGQTALRNQPFIGKSLEDIIPESRIDFLLHFYTRAATFHKCVTFEEEIQLNDKHLNYETVLTPIENNDETYIIAVVRDISERTKQYEELMRSNYLLEKNKQRLSTLIENNSDAIFMLDSDGFFLEANHTMEQMSGYSTFELLGTNFSQLFPRTELPKVGEYFRRVLLGETLEYETILIHKDGSEIFLNLKSIAIKNDTLGHDVGDEVIKVFANRVKSILLKKDTLSRVGGDEFTIVIPELESIEQLECISERILNAAKEPMLLKGEIIHITTSIGISIYPNTNTIDALYKEADRNLYKSKDLGGDTYTITNS